MLPRTERAGVEIRYYNIIYDLVDDVKAAMSGLLAPTLRETMLGNAQILEVFNISKVGKIAGCRVLDGVVQRGVEQEQALENGRIRRLLRRELLFQKAQASKARLLFGDPANHLADRRTRKIALREGLAQFAEVRLRECRFAQIPRHRGQLGD